jgi:hypothetical protein
MKKDKQKQPPDKQVAAFRKAAREAGCDDNEERFQDALRTVAKAKPSVEKPKRSQQQQEDKAKE